ncbi:hypothetical protein D3C72_1835400 [compost metagenome]
MQAGGHVYELAGATGILIGIADHDELAEVEHQIFRLAILGDAGVLGFVILADFRQGGDDLVLQSLMTFAVEHGLRHDEVHVNGGCRRGAGRSHHQSDCNCAFFHFSFLG